MTTRLRFLSILAYAFALCLNSSYLAQAAQHSSSKTAKTILHSITTGPTGPIPQLPLDSIPTLPPQVTYQNGELTIVASNSTLSDVLIAVRKRTGAEMEIPVASDRVVTRLGPGLATVVLSELLTGSRFNFVLVSSPEDASVLKRVVLLAKTPINNSAKQSVAGQNAPMSQAATTNQLVQDQAEEPQGMLETPDNL